MATGVSQDWINQNIAALSQIYPSLDKEIIYSVVQHCQSDFINASKLLAEISNSNAPFKETTKTIHYRNDRNFAGDYSRPNDLYASIINLIRNGYKIVILLRGLPGSGKSTLAKKLLHESLGEVDENEFIINIEQCLSSYQNTNLDDPFQWSHKQCYSNMRKGISPIIIDDNHLEIQTLKPYCLMAVKFGYIIEIVAPLTSWALNPKALSIQTNFKYDEQRLKEMLQHYQQNVAVKDLFEAFNLKYIDEMPQFRIYPPLEVSSHVDERNVLASNLGTLKPPQEEYGALENQKTQLPIEYIHKFEVRRETIPPKTEEPGIKQMLNVKKEIKSDSATAQLPQLPVEYVNRPEAKRETFSFKKREPDVKQPLNTKKEIKPKSPTAEDLIDFLNEHKLSPKQEDPISPADAEEVTKQLRENKELMIKLMAFLNQQLLTTIRKPPLEEQMAKTTKEIPMEVDETPNIENQDVQNKLNNTDHKQISSSVDNLELLKKENKMLREKMNINQDLKLEEIKLEMKNTDKLITDSTSKKADTPDAIAIISSEMGKPQFGKPNREDEKSEIETQAVQNKLIDYKQIRSPVDNSVIPRKENKMLPEMMNINQDLKLKQIKLETKNTDKLITDSTSKKDDAAIISSEMEKPQFNQPNRKVDEKSKIENQDVQNKLNNIDHKQISSSVDNSEIPKNENRTLNQGLKLEERKLEMKNTDKLIMDSTDKKDDKPNVAATISSEKEKFHFEKLKKKGLSSNFEIMNRVTLPDTEKSLKSPVTSSNEKRTVMEFIRKPIRYGIYNRNNYTPSDSVKQIREPLDADNLQTPKDPPKKLPDVLSYKKIPLDVENKSVEGDLLLKLKDENRENIDKSKEIFPKVSLQINADFQKKHVEEKEKNKQQEESAKQGKQKVLLELDKPMEPVEKITSENAQQLKNVETGAVPRQQILTGLEKKSDPKLETVKDIQTCNGNLDSDGENVKAVEDLVQLNLGSDLAHQLEVMFGQLVVEGESFAPVVQLPKSLARQLHALYLESICLQRDNQNEYISKELRESVSGNGDNEVSAMSSYQKVLDQQKDITPDGLALKLAQEKLHSIFEIIKPQVLDDILTECDNNYQVAVKMVMKRTGTLPMATANSESLLKPPISDTILAEMRKQHQIVNTVPDEADGIVKSATYRDATKGHMQQRQELLQLAEKQERIRSNEVAKFYRHLAQIELQKAEISNKLAVQRYTEENAERMEKCDTLNLHFFHVKDAIVTLDAFIDKQIMHLGNVNLSHKHYFVVTGRSKIEREMSQLKSAIVERLKYRKIRFSSINPGMLQILIEKNLPRSSNL